MQKCDAALQAASAVAPLIQGISSKADVSSSAGTSSSSSSSSRAALFQSIHSEVTRTFATSRAKVQLVYCAHWFACG
jgi:hypothetical protein